MANWAAVAQVVSKRMQERGITQRELSESSGVSVATLRKIQRGADQARNRSTLANLSRALGFPDDYLWKISTAQSADSGAGAAATDGVWSAIADLRQRVEAIESRLSP